MKKTFFATAVLMGCMLASTANAQSILSNLLSGAANAATNAAANGQTGKEAANSALNNVVNNALGNVGNVAQSAGLSEETGNLLGNLISSVVGSKTTTANNLIGSWSYTKPAVQFESQNELTKAGGTLIADKVESKLTTYYKLVGIKADKMKFVFENGGKVTYSVGSITRNGTYTFDEKEKTVTITTTAGANIKAYVTIVGNQMSLCFDATKLLTLMTTLGSKFSALSTVTTLAGQYSGMKVGFEFAK